MGNLCPAAGCTICLPLPFSPDEGALSAFADIRINYKYHGAALNYALLPEAAFCQAPKQVPIEKGCGECGEGSTESQALPVLPLLQLLSTHWLVLCLRLQSVPAPKVLPTVQMFSEINSEKHTLCKHHLSSQMTQHGAPSTNKNGPKKAQRHSGKKTHLVKGFSALFTAIGTVIMVNWLVGHKNRINWDTEETIESKETNRNKWDKRWKAEMQSLNCSCNSAGNSHILE